MKGFLKNKALLFIIFAAVFIFAAIFLNRGEVAKRNDFALQTQQIQKHLLEKENRMQEMLAQARQLFEQGGSRALFSAEPFEQDAEAGLFVFIYVDDTLAYWSDENIPLFQLNEASARKEVMLKLENGWYRQLQVRSGTTEYIGLISIKNEYRYENDYLGNGFQEDFGVKGDHKIALQPGEFNIYSAKQEHLFSIDFHPDNASGELQSNVLFILYFIGFLFLIASLFHLHLRLFQYYKNTWLLVGGYILDVIVLRFFMFVYKIPTALYESMLFSPLNYASSDWLPSFGDLMVNILLLLILAWFFYKYFRFTPGAFKVVKRPWNWIIVASLVFILGLFFVFSFRLIRGMVLDSVIPYTVNNVFNLNYYSLLGFIIMSATVLSLVLVTIRLVSVLTSLSASKGDFLVPAGLACALFFTIQELRNPNDIVLIISYLIFVFAFWFFRERGRYRFLFSRLLFSIIFFSALTTYVLNTSNEFKENEKRKSLAQKLSASQDPVAEYLYTKVVKDIYFDQKITEILANDLNREEVLVNHILQNYFRGYWDKYQIQITLCEQTDSLFLQPALVNISCGDYFRDIIRNFGRETSCPSLYILNYATGGNSYLSTLDFPLDSGSTMTAFIELYSKFIPKGLGYPELLIDKKIFLNSDLSSYSYARYRNGTLVDGYGKYYYSMNLETADTLCGNQNFYAKNGFSHLVYRADKNNILIISKKEENILSLLAPFSLLFLFFALFVLLFFLIIRFPFKISQLRLNFKNRLQLSMIAIILISFVLIGISMYYYIRNLNENKNSDNLSEKALSIQIELQSKLADYDTITPEVEAMLDLWLVKFSNVFFTDINLYDLNGQLISTSRPQIFQEGLLSPCMNPGAFKELDINRKTIFIQQERIGTLRYYSAYLPFYTNDNRLRAYLNLPYFARENELKQELSLFMMTFINIYVFLIAIAIVIALIIAGRMTRPLNVIRAKIGRVRLGGRNEKISWHRQDDEISNLVMEYNRMIDELALSAELLAKSERESAWREMAKQVAHEIKNPLTPMKLSVQYLEKAWRENSPGWEEKLQRFSQTLIEQIDSLSAIATAFSDFAKMPKSELQRINIVECIHTAITTFSGSVTPIEFMEKQIGALYVLADRKQMIRVMVNLLTNAIQAIDGAPAGRICVEATNADGKIRVCVSDNGPGIPDVQKSRIFVPNFSTKTEGMGLGLAMVKNIIEGHGGQIWFVSREGEGAMFCFELPEAPDQPEEIA